MLNSSIKEKTDSLKNLLNTNNCFKLICAAGNKNLEEIEKLVAIYAKAGCRFFDIAADEKVLIAAQKGLDFSIPKDEQKHYHFCISIGTKNDQHIQKARIDSDKCKRCEKCVKACPQKAISQYFKVIKDKCIGCLKCNNVCNHEAIEIYSEPKSFSINQFKDLNISCIELHISDAEEKETNNLWEEIKMFDGLLSLCLGREKLSNEKIINRIKRLLEQRESNSIIIQADGSPMSGGEDDYKTTLQAVAMAEIIQKSNLPVYILLSGGTNSKTAELARLCKIKFNGISIGSFARKIVKEDLEKEDFWTNQETFNQAVEKAKTLISSTQNK